MKRGKPFIELGAYSDTVLSLLALGLVLAATYELIRVACADLFKWIAGN